MSQICCTVKLLKELGVPVNSCPKPEEPSSPFEQWYAMLFYWGGRKCVLFFNPQTTLTAVALFVKRAQIRDMESLARNAIGLAVDQLEVSLSAKDRIKADVEGVSICRTDDRGAVACMNQIVLQIEWVLASDCVIAEPLLRTKLACWLNAANLVRYKFPREVLAKVLADLSLE